MVAQGRAARSGGAGRLVRVFGLGVLTIIVAVSVWKIATWAFHRTVGYDIKGQWRAESTAVLGYKLPIGVNLAFDESGAHVLDQHVKVVAYEREGNEVSVVVQPDSGPQINLVFAFEDRDHMVLAGPLGISTRYRRVKIAQ